MLQASTIIPAIMVVAWLAFFSIALVGIFASTGIGILPASGLAVFGVGLVAAGVSQIVKNYFFKTQKRNRRKYTC